MHLRTMLNSKNPVYDFSNLVVALLSDWLLAEWTALGSWKGHSAVLPLWCTKSSLLDTYPTLTFGSLFHWGVVQKEHEANCSSLFTTEVKNVCSFIILSPKS